MKINLLSKKIPQNLDELQKILLENRNLKTKKEIEEFLAPSPVENLSYKDVGIDEKEMKKAIKLIKDYIGKKIVIYSDYDADGVCAGAILWQALYSVGADVMPFIPSREEDGYGLSKSGIDKVLALYPNQKILIITVDNGIVANEAAEYLKKRGGDKPGGLSLRLVITDHHVKPDKLPTADCILHTTFVCGAGVVWFLAKEIFKNFKITKNILEYQDTIDLLTIATVADMVPLTKFNRQIVKAGFPKLKKTVRPGLLALFQEAAIIPDKINTHTIGFVIAPRVNAMGRLTSALNSLRLLCTRDLRKAEVYARELGVTNRERQNLTFEQTEIASMSVVKKHEGNANLAKVLIEIDESFNQGVIGLIAGRLMEKFYRPAIVVARGESVSKASVRSIPGFNIIEHLRQTQHLLINCGGHPMAAGFTIETEKIELFTQEFMKIADRALNEEDLIKKMTIDCELPISLCHLRILSLLDQFSPFGVANSEPLFLMKDVEIMNIRYLGTEGQHVKFVFKKDGSTIEAIAFNFAKKCVDLQLGQRISIIFSLSANTFNGKTDLQVKVREIITS